MPFYTRTTKLGKRRQIQATQYGIENLAQLGLLAALFTGGAVLYGMVFGLRMLPGHSVWISFN